MIRLKKLLSKDKLSGIQKKYREFSMIPAETYIGNLKLAIQFSTLPGCIVECGVWRGGMIAGLAELLPKDKRFYLFDSFEGLPPAREIDGTAANAWQQDKKSPLYLDNCKAEMRFAEKAMQMSGRKNYKLVKGWFSETLPQFTFAEQIAILRLDGDWYDSTMDCFSNLFHKVAKGGVVIIDDYYVWDGCSRAVHDFLSQNNLTVRIRQSPEGIGYIIKD